ncbi:hypothetical protein BP5796_03837 [Coleophoma crateriformis]|uniref:Uncharacterized protein n=1 Tax=Coleophoma crateriformis TaxID=565419 RepID=A0A3D8SGW7_9HELO|nr:hypothetical protein BP5796_03837 [Coleophoma crateriformis]
MMGCEEWNDEEMPSAGAAAREVTAKAPRSRKSHYNTTSFTPINQRHTDIVNPLDTRQNIDTGTLSDLPAETSFEPILPLPKKRSRKKAVLSAPGRSLALGHVWEYEDEGDTALQNPGVDFNNLATKRQKMAPATRSNSPIKVFEDLGQPKHGAEELDPVDEGDLDSDIMVPPLTTVPIALEEVERRTVSAGLKSNTRQRKLFQRTKVTKISSASQKVRPNATPIQTLSHQRWRTTEDAVKSSSTVLAQTTLQRLATFRYHAPSVEPAILPLSIHPHHDKVTDMEWNQPQDKTGIDNLLMARYSPDGYRSLSRDVLFEHATGQDTSLASSRRAVKQDVDPGSLSILCATSSTDTVGNHDTNRFVDKCMPITAIDSSSTQVETWESTPLTLDHCQYTLSETTITDTVNENKSRTRQADNSTRPVTLVESNPHMQSHSLQESSTDMYHTLQAANFTSKNNWFCNQNPSFESGITANNLPPQDLLTIITDPPRTREHITSDMSVVDEAVKDYWASDDFDEGIEDDELLALVSDPVVPENPSAASHVQSNPRCREAVLVHKAGCDTSIATRHLVSSPTLIEDDEFSDSELDSAFLKVPPFLEDIHERFVPPSSLHFSDDDDSRTREYYDPHLKFSPPNTAGTSPAKCLVGSSVASPEKRLQEQIPNSESENWNFMRLTRIEHATNTFETPKTIRKSAENIILSRSGSTKTLERIHTNKPPSLVLARVRRTSNRSHEYEPLSPFARPRFPGIIRDRSPILGLSGHTILRTCFRIGEMIREGGRCEGLRQDALIELFARVTYSARESGTSRQHFQFADLFHDRPPFPKGVLENYKSSSLAESESKVLVDSDEELLVRCLGRLIKDRKNSCWLLKVVNIRMTDWEEVRWTKRVVSADKTDLE